MANRNEAIPTDLAAQLRRHLESMRAAGVEWLPASGHLPARPAGQEDKGTRGQGDKGTKGGGEMAVVPAAAPGALSGPLVPLSPFPLVPVAPEDRRQELTLLAEQVSGCTRCTQLAATRTQTVFGVGRIDPDLCFVGEAPGADEDAQGEPFVGKAGQLLTRIIGAMGMTRDDVYICNILRCRPPGNRQPEPEEAANCREWLERTLELVRPRFICALGASAVKYLMGTNTGITRLRGKFLDYRGIPVMCTFHPSYLLRDPTKKKEVWEDMKTLLTRMGKPIPKQQG